MPTVSGGNIHAVRMDNLDIARLLNGTTLQMSSSSLVIDIGGGYVEYFTGQNVTYDFSGFPVSGTITSIEERLFGSTTFLVTGMNTSVSQFASWARAHDTNGALEGIFAGDDVMLGSPNGDVLAAFGGNNNMFGGAGADTLIGGFGNDHIYGQSPNGGSDGADYINGYTGSDYIQGNAGNDTLDGGDGSDRINGGADNDSIIGGTGNDTVNGNLGNDTISGGGDNDSLRGGQGNDSINGDAGNDIVQGDLGADTLTGGTGSDIFLFSGQASTSVAPDRITDFVSGTDHLSLGFSPAAMLTGTIQTSLTAAASAAQSLFDGHAGDHEVAALAVGSDTYIFYSSTGGATADSAVLLVGVSASSLGVSDFIL